MADQATVKVFIESDRASVEKAKKELEKSFGTGPMGIQPKIGGSIDKGLQKINKVIDSEMNSISSKAKTLFLGIGATITGTIGLISGLFAGVYKATRAGVASVKQERELEMSLRGQGVSAFQAKTTARTLREQERDIVGSSGKTPEEIRRVQGALVGAGLTDARQINASVKDILNISSKSRKELTTVLEGYTKVLLGQGPGIEGTGVRVDQQRFAKMTTSQRFMALRGVSQDYLGKEGSNLYAQEGNIDELGNILTEIKYIWEDISRAILEEVTPSARDMREYLSQNKEQIKELSECVTRNIWPAISTISETISDIFGASRAVGGFFADKTISAGKLADRAMALPSSILASAAKLNERNPLQREFYDANSAYLSSKARGDDPRLTARLESAMYRSIRKRNQEIELRMKIKQEPERMSAPHGVARK